ncbi:MAG: hypothetical protein CMH64_02815 [Nanoarchaeota archaeon]|nr:hypothetical protein [Nanoarchaeota archaeon]MAF51001.1 hypothetical protein [Nanoarchaeota archaeon]|tara:strand:- start:68 stop:733 length:666 start_codon:yes stop_codon:yes gene_type:complete
MSKGFRPGDRGNKHISNGRARRALEQMTDEAANAIFVMDRMRQEESDASLLYRLGESVFKNRFHREDSIVVIDGERVSIWTYDAFLRDMEMDNNEFLQKYATKELFEKAEDEGVFDRPLMEADEGLYAGDISPDLLERLNSANHYGNRAKGNRYRVGKTMVKVVKPENRNEDGTKKHPRTSGFIPSGEKEVVRAEIAKNNARIDANPQSAFGRVNPYPKYR